MIRVLCVIAALVCFTASSPLCLFAGDSDWNERFVTLDPGEVPLGKLRRTIDIRPSGGIRVLDVDVHGARLLDPSGKGMQVINDALSHRNADIPYAVMVYSHPKYVLSDRESEDLVGTFMKAFPGKRGYLIFFIGQEQSGCLVKFLPGNEAGAAAELTGIVLRSGGKLDLKTGRLSCMRPHRLLEAILEK